MFGFLKPYQATIELCAALALFAALSAAVFAFGAHEREIGRAAVQAAWDRANAVAFRVRGERIAAARKAETDLQESANEERRRDAKTLDDLNARVLALSGELRDRTGRPVAQAGRADVHQQPAGPGAGCTGAGLYREDAGFLVGDSAAAALVARQRDACYAAYGRAQEALRRQGLGVTASPAAAPGR